jgi:hypothetical protein
VPQKSAAGRQNHWPMPRHQRLERLSIVRGGIPLQELTIG